MDEMAEATPDQVPLDLLRIIYRALSKEPATRYQSCREMVADLKEVRTHLDPTAQLSPLPAIRQIGQRLGHRAEQRRVPPAV